MLLSLIGEIWEGSTAYLRVSFLDKDGDQEVPSLASYRIDDVATGVSIRGSTALTPASSIEIEITPTDTAILSQDNAYEDREITVSATFGVGGASNGRTKFRVNNLSFKS